MRVPLDPFDEVALFVIVSLAVAGAALMVVCAGCAPETDLVGAGAGGPGTAAGVAAPGPGGGLLVDPTAGSAEVPVNLAAVMVRFPAPVTLPPGALRVCAGAPSAS